MKNILRTSTIILLVLGLGVSLPKIIDSRAIDKTTLEGIVPSELGNSLADKDSKTNQAAMRTQDDLNTIMLKNIDFEENTVEIINNFPIKTDMTENALEVEPKVESSLQKEQNPDNNSKVDKKTATVPQPEENNVAKAEQIKEVNVPEVAPKPETLTEVNASYDRFVKSSLNVRTGPGTTYDKKATLKTGEKVHVTKVVSNGWSFIEVNGISGYVSSSYLVKTAPVQKAPEITTPTPPKDNPGTKPEPTPPKVEPAKPSTPSYAAYRMIVGGKTLPYKNGGLSDGQRIIDSNTGMLSTWGGAETYSGSDEYNTHFIGHNPGAFSVLKKISMGATIIVTDGSATPTTYYVTNIFTVDDNAYNKKDGVNYYNYLASKRGGEVITLQTCLSSDENLIIRAEKR